MKAPPIGAEVPLSRNPEKRNRYPPRAATRMKKSASRLTTLALLGLFLQRAEIATNKVIADVRVGDLPTGVAVDSVRSTVYIVDSASQEVSVLNGKTNALERTITIGGFPNAAATDLISGKSFVSNLSGDTISVIPL